MRSGVKSQEATVEQRRYWTAIAEKGCIICGSPAEIAHAHGPSLTARGFQKPKGVKFRWQHWLVIPLCAPHHRLDTISLDNALTAWEARYGLTCAELLDQLVRMTGIDVWAKARALLKPAVGREKYLHQGD